ncbi:MAG: hypothetical protein AAF441_06075 [Pseudomonadota bacterium]
MSLPDEAAAARAKPKAKLSRLLWGLLALFLGLVTLIALMFPASSVDFISAPFFYRYGALLYMLLLVPTGCAMSRNWSVLKPYVEKAIRWFPGNPASRFVWSRPALFASGMLLIAITLIYSILTAGIPYYYTLAFGQPGEEALVVMRVQRHSAKGRKPVERQCAGELQFVGRSLYGSSFCLRRRQDLALFAPGDVVRVTGTESALGIIVDKVIFTRKVTDAPSGAGAATKGTGG